MAAGGITIDDGVMIGPNVCIVTDRSAFLRPVGSKPAKLERPLAYSKNHDFQNRMVLRPASPSIFAATLGLAWESSSCQA